MSKKSCSWAVSLGFSLFSTLAFSQTEPMAATGPDSLNPRLETALIKQFEAINAEIRKAGALLGQDTVCRFTPALNDSLVSVYDRLATLVNDPIASRVVWPLDTTEYGDDDEWPMDTTAIDTTAFSPPSNLFKPKKSKRTILTWGISWGAIAALGSENGSDPAAGIFQPFFDFGESRHQRYAIMLRTRLGKRDTMPNFDIAGRNGKPNPMKMRDSKDQFRASKFNLKYGIVFERLFLRQKNALSLSTTATGAPVFTADSDLASVRRNELAIRYVDFSFLFEAMMTKNVKLEIGPYAGIRTRAQQLIEYEKSPFEFVRTRRDALGLRKMHYGVMAGFGFKWLFFDTKFDLSNLFIDNPLYDVQPMSVGFTFGL